MPARTAMGIKLPHRGIAVLLVVLVGCLSPQEPEPAADRIAPGAPNLARLRAHVPDAHGVAWITGAAGCVEADVAVLVRESGGSHAPAVRGQASSAGAFEIGITAARLATIEVIAIDAAGNTSGATLLAIGAPFQLVPACRDTLAVAGDSLDFEVSVLLLDESGAAAPGVEVSFAAGTLPDGRASATTRADGVATWSSPTPTQAGSHALTVSVPAALLAAAATCTLRVQPGAVADLEVAAGSEQVGAPASRLTDVLVCRALDRFGNRVPGRTVTWAAAGGSLSSLTGVTDARGEASVHWTLPAVAGEWEAQATLSEIQSIATFVGIAGGPPAIDAMSPDPATPGGELTLLGGPFSRDPRYDEVLLEWDGIDHAAAIVSAAIDRLVVRVPAESRSGNLHLRVCGRAASPAPVRVEQVLGTVHDVPAGTPLRLETPRGDEEYVVALFTAAETPVSFQVGSVAAKPGRTAVVRGEVADADAFHAWLRQQERRMQGAPRAAGLAPAKPMSQRTFAVLADLSGSSYASVTATLRYSSSSVLIYVDDRVPPADLSEAHLDGLADRFAGSAYGAVVGAFGSASDVDGDGRVLVLLTPTVNQLTPPGSGAYVGGFFFAADLHNVAHSNRAEMLYTMVPDPTGRWGNVFPVQSTLDVLDGVLPHELQHLINYNQHALLRGGDPEDLWLNEALSHVAEGLCGEMLQNRLRANRFLADPQLVSLTAGGNALAERGMSFLFMRFVADHEDATFLRRLVQTTRTGRDNVEHASGRGLELWLRDWVAALVLDHAGLAQEPRYRYASLDLGRDFNAPRLHSLNLKSPSAAGILEPTSCRFYRLQGTTAPHTDLVVQGAGAVVYRIR